MKGGVTRHGDGEFATAVPPMQRRRRSATSAGALPRATPRAPARQPRAARWRGLALPPLRKPRPGRRMDFSLHRGLSTAVGRVNRSACFGQDFARIGPPRSRRHMKRRPSMLLSHLEIRAPLRDSAASRGVAICSGVFERRPPVTVLCVCVRAGVQQRLACAHQTVPGSNVERRHAAALRGVDRGTTHRQRVAGVREAACGGVV